MTYLSYVSAYVIPTSSVFILLLSQGPDKYGMAVQWHPLHCELLFIHTRIAHNMKYSWSAQCDRDEILSYGEFIVSIWCIFDSFVGCRCSTSLHVILEIVLFLLPVRHQIEWSIIHYSGKKCTSVYVLYLVSEAAEMNNSLEKLIKKSPSGPLVSSRPSNGFSSFFFFICKYLR